MREVRFIRDGEALDNDVLPHTAAPTGTAHATTRSPLTVDFRGRLYNRRELAAEAALDHSASPAQITERLYLKRGAHVFRSFNGAFALVIRDHRDGSVVMARDHLGIEPLFYRVVDGHVHHNHDPIALARVNGQSPVLDPAGLHALLLFNYNPLADSILSGVHTVEPAHVLRWQFDGSADGTLRSECFWAPSFEPDHSLSEGDIIDGLRTLLADAVAQRSRDAETRGERPGVFLSGGMDSSAVVSLLRAVCEDEITTFSYRCRGKHLDESAYARVVAASAGTTHHLIDYPPEAALSVTELVRHMHDPFDDTGIVVASYLLAKHAAGRVDYIMTGDGGDELFAGHPVYTADRLAAPLDRLPARARQFLANTLTCLPDPKAKKNLFVKLKRFGEGLSNPPSMLSNRWRMYYSERELRSLLLPELWRQIKHRETLGRIAHLCDGADAGDPLGRALCADYLTVVRFYLRRMRVVASAGEQRGGLEPRLPMLDHRLIEFAARIPAHFKRPRRGDTKQIFKRAMAGLMPDEIIHRRDKAGHTVPMKQWLRAPGPIQEMLRDVLSENATRRRGLFSASAVQNMIDEHMNRRRDHSHRLWTLLLLELWMREHL